VWSADSVAVISLALKTCISAVTKRRVWKVCWSYWHALLES